MRTLVLCVLFLSAFVFTVDANAQSMFVHAKKPYESINKVDNEHVTKQVVNPAKEKQQYRTIVTFRYYYDCDCCCRCCCDHKPVKMVREVVSVPFKVTGNIIKDAGRVLDKTGDKFLNLVKPDCKNCKS